MDFDTFDIHIQQLISMIDEKQIKISPAYQRQFRWDDKRCSQLVESIMLGIPVPSLFMATDADSTWEVVDGVQRLSAIVKFAGSGELRIRHSVGPALILEGLQKLSSFSGLTIEQLPTTLRIHFLTRPIKVITLNDKSDNVVRYDLFERLNTGGVALTPQEIRDCVYQGPFADQLDHWAKTTCFRAAVRLTSSQQSDATAEECVLRFFAFLNRYKEFKHDVAKFLNDYMAEASKRFDYYEGDQIFTKTFKELARVFPEGISRPDRRGTTPLNLFEGIAVGAALALASKDRLNITDIREWMSSPELRKFTTGATNNPNSVVGRIEFCRDRFLGKKYVPRPKA